MEDNSKKKTRILIFLLCLSLIVNGILGYSYTQNVHYYEQLSRDADYTIEQLRSEYSDRYDEGYNDGYDDAKEDYKPDSTSLGDNTSSYESYSGGDTSDKDYIGTTVYITDTGSKYHRYGCQYLRQSCQEISISDAESQGYTPCSVCW